MVSVCITSMIILSCGNDTYGPKIPSGFCLLAVNCIHPQHTLYIRILHTHTHTRTRTHTHTCPHHTTCSSLSSSTQEYCYDDSGRLLTGSPGGGSVHKVPLAKNRASHFQEDIRPYLLCCTGYTPTCQKYYERRPSDNGTRYEPAVPGKLTCIYDQYVLCKPKFISGGAVDAPPL